MHVSRGRLGFAAIALAVLSVAARGGSPNGPRATASTNQVAAPAQTSAMSTVSATSLPLPGASPLDFLGLKGQVPEPSNILLAASEGSPLNADNYVISVFKSQRDFWTKYITNRGFTMPRTDIDLVIPGDVSTTPCHKGLIGKDYPAMVYCSQTQGIIVPMGWLAHQWGGTRKIGDLTAAISVSRNASTSLVNALAAQLQVAAPTPAAELYVGSCLSGVWAHSVYPQDTFTIQDIQAALDRVSTMPFELDGTVVTANASELTAAWISGFGSGVPVNCMVSFWTKMY